MRKKIAILALVFGIVLTGGCQESQKKYTRYQSAFFTFDTVVQIVGYAQSQQAFDYYAEKIRSRFEELHRLYDRFNPYEGINNIYSINQNAGIASVKVAPEVLDLVEFGLDAYTLTHGTVNIALGPVSSLWHDHITVASSGKVTAMPSAKVLEKASTHMDITKVHVNRQESTVFLEETGMLLDVGGIAKGYATQLVADEVYAEGFTSFLISAGGNIVAKDPPLDGLRGSWGIGIQNPETADDPQSPSVDVVFIKNQSVVSSGDYQRYAIVDNTRIHHLIDPTTLFPANHCRGVTVLCDDSGLGDVFSTALFVMDYPDSRAFAQEHDLMALWIFDRGRVECTENLVPFLRDRGGATSVLSKGNK